MWQANLTEWYEENPKGTTSRRRKTPPSGTTSREENRRRGQPQERGKPRRRGQPQGAALGDIGWVGYGHDGGNPKKGTTSRRRKTPASGTTSRGIAGRHRLGGDGHGGGKPQGDNLKKKKEENPAEGDNLMREGAEENPGFGENLMVGWRTMPGMGMRHRLATSGAYYFGSGGWGWLPLLTGGLERETGSDIMDASDNVRLGTWKV
ncbi:hypothetical protein PAPYR_8168 [Paratrimastix pyriformis]|uniref:Uncharacterized protein n=1 Tax=Paratrimastix pyriformis TaxID=342808 RepID=A0ABQ8UEI8_9EUKA|nr:hypothetical protein PAPYR_8168 [Paratrimastix pyriformis]